MEIREVVFRCATLRPSGVPGEWFPHVAVAGRSNVGKSSLLNWLCGRRLARVAKAPGKTRTLNFFLVNQSFFLVDLPGYGYARVAHDLRRQWGLELARYLSQEERLAGVVSLVDVRHGPTELDLELGRLLVECGLERLVVLTKADKVGRGARVEMVRRVQAQLGLARPPIATSVRTNEGRRPILDEIAEMLKSWKTQHQRRE